MKIIFPLFITLRLPLTKSLINVISFCLLCSSIQPHTTWTRYCCCRLTAGQKRQGEPSLDAEKGFTNSTSSSMVDSINIVCPPLFPPTHGYLECTRPTSTLVNSTASEQQRVSITNRPGSRCDLRCPSRFAISLTSTFSSTVS